ncbi:unnamed protein product [Heterobilharzia americana]|nr:unnamed protein product [Heterobilharzia americana]
MTLYETRFRESETNTECSCFSFNTEDVYYTYNGRIIDYLKDVPKDALLQKHYRLRGGKGGFGSMLRAIGSQIEKTTNHEMCRDLSGRRMRDVNMEKKLKEWYATADKRERQKMEEYLERRRRRQEILQQGPLPGHKFSDRDYERQKRKIAYELQSALYTAIENVSNEKKQVASTSSSSSTGQPNVKRTRLWIEELDDVLCSDSSEDEKLESEDSLSSVGAFNFVKENDNQQNTNSNEVNIDSAEINNDDKQQSTISDEEKKQEGKPCTNAQPDVVQPLMDEQLHETDTAESLEKFGLDVLKATLSARGLKCGGTLKERAGRLFLVKDLSPDRYPVKLLAKSK